MLQPKLLGTMRRELESQNFQLPIDCKQQMERMVGQGVLRMRTGKVDDHPGYIMQAERNLKSMVKYFCDYARDAGTFPVMSSAAFTKALASCPTFWPYRSSD